MQTLKTAPSYDALSPHFGHWKKTGDLVDQCIDLMLNLRQSGHPGGSRSKVPFLVSLTLGAMRWDVRRPELPFADRFVLVAGHTNPAIYALLAVYPETVGQGEVARIDALGPPGADQFVLRRKAMDAELSVSIRYVQIPGRAAHSFGRLVERRFGGTRCTGSAPGLDQASLRVEAADGMAFGIGDIDLVLGVDPEQVRVGQHFVAPGIEVDPVAVVDQQGRGFAAGDEDT